MGGAPVIVVGTKVGGHGGGVPGGGGQALWGGCGCLGGDMGGLVVLGGGRAPGRGDKGTTVWPQGHVRMAPPPDTPLGQDDLGDTGRGQKAAVIRRGGTR